MLNTFAATDLHVSLAAEELWKLGPITITNAVFFGTIGVLLTVWLLVHSARRIAAGRKSFIARLVQWAFEGFLSQAEEIIGDKATARRIFPLAITMFFVILINYWMSVLPGVGAITLHGVPVFRALPADLNFTFALAIITIVASQIYAVRKHGFFGNVGRFIKNPIKDPIGAFEGVLEFIGEFSRMVALSFRLFGNAFAGEVLLLLIAVLAGYFAFLPLPFFMAFEVFIGFIQAYVFFMLTLIFTSLALTTHGGHDDAHSPAPVLPEAAK